MQLKSEDVSSGFHINWMNLIDNDTGVVLWHTNENYALPGIEHEVTMPRKVLDCKSVTRTINFSSVQRINHLKLKHKEFLQGCCIEEWVSEFGTVLAKTDETWETIFIPREGSTSSFANVLSGNLSIETNFYDADKLITTSNILMFYE